MRTFLQTLLGDDRWYLRRIELALKLERRGEVRERWFAIGQHAASSPDPCHHLRVTKPQSGDTILSGEIERAAFDHARSSPSVRMRLIEIGVNFQSLELDCGYQLLV